MLSSKALRLIKFAVAGAVGLLLVGVGAWNYSNWLRTRTIALRDVNPAMLERVPYHSPEPDNPKLAGPPDDMFGGNFSFQYPNMQQVAWPGEASLMYAKEQRSYQLQADSFPVFLAHLGYEPWPVDQGPPHIVPPRPWSVMRRLGAPDAQRQPSQWPKLDLFVSARYDADWLGKHPKEPQPTQVYIGAVNVPYELLVSCDPTLTCRADVYSERSRFAFTLEYPSEGVAHTYDLVESADRMLVSMTPPGGAIDEHWRDASSDHSVPEPTSPNPPDCTSPAYTPRTLTNEVEWPMRLAIGHEGSLYVLSEHWPKPPVVWRFTPTELASEAPTPRRTTGALTPPIGALAVDAKDRLVIASMKSLLRPSLSDEPSPKESIVVARGLSVAPIALRIDDHDSAFYIGVSEGIVLERPRSQASGSKERLVAHNLIDPVGLAVTPAGALYVTDGDRHQLLQVDARGDAHALPVALRHPGAVVSDSKGTLYLVDDGIASIQRINADGQACAVTRDMRSYLDITVDVHGHIFANSLRDGVVVEFSPRRSPEVH